MASDASRYWSEYQPTDHRPWNVRRVVHLHRRAGFAATWNEIQRDLEDGPVRATERVLSGESRTDALPRDFEQISSAICDAAVGSGDPNRLKAWWIYRMLYTPDPLTEKLALMWHNHFATSNLKVNDLALMYTQNEIFRQHARAPFGHLCAAVVRDPAMLVWLDADSNRKGSPNENLARELMELFTLGIGNYAESDVKETSRALTGWGVRRNTFFENDQVHDAGRKTILNRTGNWSGNDALQVLWEHPATSARVAWRVCRLFMGEGTVDDARLEHLAGGFRDHDLDVGWLVSTVLRSEGFFAEENVGTRVSSPIEFTIGAARALALVDPPPSTLLLAEWNTRMGFDLFYPPNVGGWSGGRDWLSSRYVVARANYAVHLIQGKLSRRSVSHGLAERHAVPSADLSAAVDYFDRLLSGGRISNRSRSRLLDTVQDHKSTDEERLGQAVALLLSLPESQLS